MEAIVNDLRGAIGLDPSSIGLGAIERAVRQRVAASNTPGLDRYRQLLHESPDELRELIDALVVPETWFFRDRGAFDAVTAEARSPAHPRQLRYLCVPCATGEEPLSLAMALLDAGIPADRFHIDAFDISERLVVHAKTGVYSRNSFRGNDTGFRARYFQDTGKGCAIDPAVRAQAGFRQANLLDDSAFSDGQVYDAIFCRNLLIYFGPEARAKAVKKLAGMLRKGGLFCVAPAETGLLLRNGFTPADFPQSFAFRKEERKPAALLPARPADVRSPALPPLLRSPEKAPQVKTTPLPIAKPAPAIPPPPALTDAMRLANEGRFAEVSEICRSHLQAHGPSADAYHLLALVSDASGRYEEAVMFYRKALYIDPQHRDTLAHYSLLADKLGETAAAGALRRRAMRIESNAA